jgi:hypothetical protein
VEGLRLGLPLVLGLSVVVAVVGQRRLPARSPAWVWAVSLPVAALPLVMLWAGVALLAESPLLGILVVGAGVAFLSIWVGMTRRSIERVQAARTDRDVSAALDAPVTEIMLAWTGLTLIIGIVGGALLLASAVITRAG